jgi:hypothetical protein
MRTFHILIMILVLTGCIYMPVNREPVYNVPRTEQSENRIKLGMSMAEVRERWGEPIKIIKGNGKRFNERWIYQPHWKIQRRLDFKDDVLIYGIKDQ